MQAFQHSVEPGEIIIRNDFLRPPQLLQELFVHLRVLSPLSLAPGALRRHALPQLFNGLGPEFLGTAVRVNLNIRNVLFQMRIIVGSFPQLDALRAQLLVLRPQGVKLYRQLIQMHLSL